MDLLLHRSRHFELICPGRGRITLELVAEAGSSCRRARQDIEARESCVRTAGYGQLSWQHFGDNILHPTLQSRSHGSRAVAAYC